MRLIVFLKSILMEGNFYTLVSYSVSADILCRAQKYIICFLIGMIQFISDF